MLSTVGFWGLQMMYLQDLHSLKLRISPVQMDGLPETSLSFCCKRPVFRGELLVSGHQLSEFFRLHLGGKLALIDIRIVPQRFGWCFTYIQVDIYIYKYDIIGAFSVVCFKE